MDSLTKACVFALLLGFCSWHCFGKSLRAPIHASCQIDWTFGLSCQNVSQTIMKQIAMWNNTNCTHGEKCRYMFLSFDKNVLKAKHATPVKMYIDDLTFTFKNSSTNCAVHGYSTSEVWYAVLDYGTNYCNLHNLIIGSGLNKNSKYAEKTSDDVCTEYSKANCEKY